MKPVAAVGLASLALAACVATSVATTASAQDCPLSRFTCFPGERDSSTAASGAFGCDNAPASPVDSAFAYYDHPTGRIGARGEGRSFSQAGIESWDRFTLEGPPPGTPLTVRARLHVVGRVQPVEQGVCCAAAGALLGVEEHVGRERLTWGQEVAESFDDFVEMDVDIVAGTPFLIHSGVGAQGSGDGRAWLDATLEFANFPAGSVIRSCGGFVQGGATPTLSSSWGRVKSAYR